MAREGAIQKRDSLQKVDMVREKATLEDTAKAMEEEVVVETDTIIKEDTMAMAVDMVGEIIGVEEVDIMRRVVDGRGGTMVGTTTAAETSGEVARQEEVIIDLKREATLMPDMKMGEVTTGTQERMRAMSERRANLVRRQIMLETLKMPKVRTRDAQYAESQNMWCVEFTAAPDLSIVLLRGSALPEQLNVIWGCLAYEFGMLLKIIN